MKKSDVKPRARKKPQEVYLKEEEILPYPLLLSPRDSLSPEGLALQTQGERMEQGGQRRGRGDRRANCGGWDDTRKFGELNLHRSSQTL